MGSNPERKARVVLVDDYPQVLAALGRLLRTYCDVVASVSSGREAIDAVSASARSCSCLGVNAERVDVESDCVLAEAPASRFLEFAVALVRCVSSRRLPVPAAFAETSRDSDHGAGAMRFAMWLTHGTIPVMANQKAATDSVSDQLTARERAFVEHYLLAANGARAAKAAGYSANSANVRAVRFLNRPRVAAAIRDRQQARAERVGIDADRVLAELEELAFSNMDYYILDPLAGTVRLKPGAPPQAMKAVASIKCKAIPSSKGVIYEMDVRLWDKPSMLKLAGRHVGVTGFVDRVEVTGRNGSAIQLDQGAINAMSDEELKARVAELIAKL